jgi:amino acid adenylation domain-containing protein
VSVHVPQSDLDQRVEALVERSVGRAPSAIAVICEDRVTTYNELWDRSSQIMDRLTNAGLTPADIIAIALPRSEDLIASLLAVMRIGATYVPIDPTLPLARRELMLEDSGAAFLLSDGNEAPLRLRPQDAETPPKGSLYILYTSGSTGRPKGVLVSHRNAVNFLLSMSQEPGMSADDRLLAVTTISFDISLLEILLPLVTGGCCVLATEREARDPALLADLLERHQITIMQATPATWELLYADGWQGISNLVALCGGERFPEDLARRLTRDCRHVWNMYGPTETTVWSTVCRVLPTDPSPCLGTPIANTTVRILDTDGRIVPTSVRGEIVIGGEGVAMGYWRRPDLTRERFAPDPFSGQGRLYRTGDLGRINSRGQLEYHGRRDDQIKLRGFRIELGEVDAALRSAFGVEAASAAVFGEGEARTLVGFVTGPDVPAPDDIIEQLARTLPAYMLPGEIVVLDRLPLTPNGKVDRAALVRPEVRQRSAKPLETDMEHIVADCFAELLAIEGIGRKDDFFALGGHSILAARAVAVLRRKTGAPLTISAFFDNSTVDGLARHVESLLAPAAKTFSF